MAHMRDQFHRMGAAIDWRREVVTCYPEYYRWNQWMFLKLFEKGLAYRGDAPVNWCPRDETVLANEQVIDGRCERCDTLVVKRQMTQWFFRITQYADELLKFEGLDWPERVRVAADELDRSLRGRRARVPGRGQAGDEIRVFTTRPDTIYGATFMVLAPEHPLVAKITRRRERGRGRTLRRATARNRPRSSARRPSARRPASFTGAYAINPFNGERIPIWIADYVLVTYGTGAIMAVPAHDERDFAFARKYGLRCPRGRSRRTARSTTAWRRPTPATGVMVNSGPFNGTRSDARAEGHRRRCARSAASAGRGHVPPARLAHLAPALLGHADPDRALRACGIVPVPDDAAAGRAAARRRVHRPRGSPLTHVASFVNTTCPRCGGPARRETDTMDTFVDSSWYMYRYVDPQIRQAVHEQGARQEVAAGATSTPAASSTRSCTCCTCASSRRRYATWARSGSTSPRFVSGTREPSCSRAGKCRSRAGTYRRPTRTSKSTAPTRCASS